MDRLDAMRVFVTALDEGSLAAAGRHLGRSPAAVTRAIAFLDDHVGVQLLQRSTRKLRLTEAGECYALVCRRVLSELDEADISAAGHRGEPRGLLTITAPVMFGTHILRPIVSAFLKANPAVQVRLLLLDRIVNMIDEGVDVALRIAQLPDSSMIAVNIGKLRKVLCASPGYLEKKPPILKPSDIADHDCISVSPVGLHETWTFPAPPNSRMPRTVRVRPRLMVNADEPAVHAAVDGEGIVRLLAYKVDRELREGLLVVLLPDDEPPPVPVHLVIPEGRLSIAKVRAFVDFAAARLRPQLGRMNAPWEPAPTGGAS